MRPSFAHFSGTQHARICGLVIAFALSACASTPPPTNELAAAQQAVSRAENADADQYAAAELAAARHALTAAQAAMARGDDDQARVLADSAAADGELALARSRAATTRAEIEQRRAEIASLRQRLQLDATVEPASALDWPAAEANPAAQDPVAAFNQRLATLDADTRLQGMAAYERLRARQSVDALAAARSRQREQARQIAQRRVETAEIAARTEAARREADRLDRERSDLLVEASRQDAERARQEAERLRIEAQIQAEETQRLRAAAEAEASARQQAEEVILDVAGDQAAKLSAAREKEAALARKEAELSAGGSLPPARREARGEVFTLAGDAFASGRATLTSSAAASLRVLGAYLQAGPAANVVIEGHTDGQGEADANLRLSQQRADAVAAALAAAGVPRKRIRAVGRGESDPLADDATAAGRARNRRVEIVVSGK
ncbi:MAG TPA: OmpA family protein [Lysobacter sp.]|nr:OmpA family protein [Lysobacter sp.]